MASWVCPACSTDNGSLNFKCKSCGVKKYVAVVQPIRDKFVEQTKVITITDEVAEVTKEQKVTSVETNNNTTDYELDNKDEDDNPTDVALSEVTKEITTDEGLLAQASHPSAPSIDINLRPVDEKMAALNFYKFYASHIDTTVNEIILKYGTNTDKILDELEARILQFQKDQEHFKVYEQHTRTRRAMFIKERAAQDIEKRRKRDLTYKPFVPGGSDSVKVAKKSASGGKDKTERLILDLIKQGMSRKQAEDMLK